MAILIQLPRSHTALESAVELLHSEYEKVESLRAEIPSRELSATEETELHDCKVFLLASRSWFFMSIFRHLVQPRFQGKIAKQTQVSTTVFLECRSSSCFPGM